MIIVEDRYGGAYSGGKWVAFPGLNLPKEMGSDDSTERNFWATPPDYPVGRGGTPNEARDDLMKQFKDLTKKFGVYLEK